MINARLTAFFAHFIISLIIFSAFIFTLLYFWYPEPFFSASGGWQGLRIVALIDLVLGPVLTLIIYNKSKPKKELRNDISIIVILQLSALLWGIYTVHEQRPVAAVYWDGRFNTVTAADFAKQNLDIDTLESYGERFPVYIYAPYPETPEEWYPIVERMKNEQLAPFFQTELYQPLEGKYEEIYKHSANIDEIIAANHEMNDDLDKILLNTGTKLHDNFYIPMNSKYRNIILIFNSSNSLIGTISTPLKDL